MSCKLTALGALLAVLLIAAAGAGSDDNVRLRKVLKILTEDKQPKRREAAALALELFAREKGVLVALTDALQKDTSADVRRAAAQVLGQIGEDARTTIPALGEALRQDKSSAVREAAARALGGKMVPHSKTAAVALGEALADPDGAVRAAAAESLKDLGVDARPALRPLLSVLKDPKAGRFTQIYAIQALSRFETAAGDVVPALLASFADPAAAPGVHAAAAEALARLGPEATKAAPALAAVLKDVKAPAALRRACAVALLRVGADAGTAWPAAKVALNDPDASLRTQAIRLAGSLGKDEPEAVKALLRRCTDENNVEARLAAIQELGHLGAAAKEAAPVLRTIARNDGRASVREAAEAALKSIQGGG
jgi:HEAT repeat protein